MIRFAVPVAVLALTFNGAAPLAAAGQQTSYVVHPPASTTSPPSGWSLSASLQGRTLDLGGRTWNWADDPLLKPDERSLGYGWRGDHYSVLLGYRQEGADPATSSLGAGHDGFNNDQQHQGLVGFNWTYRPRR